MKIEILEETTKFPLQVMGKRARSVLERTAR